MGLRISRGNYKLAHRKNPRIFHKMDTATFIELVGSRAGDTEEKNGLNIDKKPDLTQKIWVEQHELMELVLGRNFWYQNEHPQLRATHGLAFLKEMSVDQFLSEARRLEMSAEGVSNFTKDI